MVNILIQSIEKSDRSIWDNWKNTQANFSPFYGVNFNDIINGPIYKYDFSGLQFDNCHFMDLQFVGCNFERSIFKNCQIKGSKSSFRNSILKHASFNQVTFSEVGFSGSILTNCIFKHCILEKLDLYGASLINSEFYDSSIIDCDIFGANIWSIKTENTVQRDLKMPYKEQKNDSDKEQITIDDIELGNIVYLLAVNSNFTKFIDQSKSSFVLVLGRFGENITRLNSIKKKLREEKFSPIVFDFKSPNTLDLIEVIILLSLLSKFIIVDLSEPRSVPAELQSILSTLMIPVVPILYKRSTVYGTYSFTNRYKWVLPVLVFDDIKDVLSIFRKAIIDPANKVYEEILEIKNKTTGMRDVKDL